MSVLLFLPGDKLPQTNKWDFLMLDKLVHFAFFAILAFLMIRGFQKQSKFSFLRHHALKYSAVIVIFYSILAEYLQQLASERHFEWQDIIANLLGSLTGLLIFYILNKINPG